MELTNEFTVPVPVERAWEVLTDVELITIDGRTAAPAALAFDARSCLAANRDLAAVFGDNTLLGNAGNIVHTAYVLSLPIGPVWILHGFYLVTMAVMLLLYLRWCGIRPGDRPDRGRTLKHGRRRVAGGGRAPLQRVR